VGRHNDLISCRIFTLGPVVLAFPIGTYMLFGAGANRDLTADLIAWTYSVGLFSAFTTSFWPLPSLRGWNGERRIESAVFLFLVVSYLTHLTWELGWLVLHDQIAAARNAAWAYPWWAYIDGGDARYASASGQLLTLESLTALVGVLGFSALWLRHWSQGTNPTATLILMATAVAHLYGTCMYFGSEMLDGFPHVDTTSFVDCVLKFWLLNGIWLLMPWAVLYWGRRTLDEQFAKRRHEAA